MWKASRNSSKALTGFGLFWGATLLYDDNWNSERRELRVRLWSYQNRFCQTSNRLMVRREKPITFSWQCVPPFKIEPQSGTLTATQVLTTDITFLAEVGSKRRFFAVNTRSKRTSTYLRGKENTVTGKLSQQNYSVNTIVILLCLQEIAEYNRFAELTCHSLDDSSKKRVSLTLLARSKLPDVFILAL